MWALHTLQIKSEICQLKKKPLSDIFIQPKLKIRHR